MIYQLLFLSCWIFLVLGGAAGYGRETRPDDPRHEDSLVFPIFVASIFVLVTGAVGLLNFIFSSRTPIDKYALELQQQMPILNGMLICEDETLTFKGTINVKFQWEMRTFQVAYPISTEVSGIATSCFLGVKPEVPSVVSKLEDQSVDAAKTIEATLLRQEVPKEATPREAELLTQLLAQLNPVNTPKLAVLTTEKSDTTNLQLKDSSSKSGKLAAANLAIPKEVAKTNNASASKKAPTVLSTEELFRNISAQ